jgi:WD40 repeat protein
VEEREHFLNTACAGDAELRAEVESLLACDRDFTGGAGAESVLQSPLMRAPELLAGTGEKWVGRYRIVRLLGEGGMGAVYEAEQDHPRRLVALKVIRPGLVLPALLKRFTHEAEILGRLNHPGIAQIYEAGVAEDGQPFFALELIRGVPLDEYVRLRSLVLPARLDLVARVCDAVQHAHEHGIIHRDLKPGNILVDDDGQPRVLDFGVARVTGADLLTTTERTRTGQLVGTLNYMSPEQIVADPAALDQRSDVYTLGVILFELLTGRLPYHLKDLPLPEAARVIREQEPLRAGSVDTHLRGDVETIVAKALEKDRRRRYASAAELAADIRRHLHSEPILARPPSALYHLRKFARRHTALVSGVLATGAALILGLLVTILFAVAEARQRAEAERHAQEALDQRREALFQTYRARIAAAAAALSGHDVADAARQLDAAPDELRDWEWRHLRNRLDDSSSVIPLPIGSGGFLLASPDQLRVGAWAGADLRLTDLEGGELKTVSIGGERGLLDAVTQTRRGLRIVAWVAPNAFHLLDEAGKILCRVEIPQLKRLLHVAVSPDGTRLAYPRDGADQQQLVVFDAASGKQTAVCAGHRGGVPSVTFSPDGKRLASGGEAEDRTARLWDTTSGALLATCRGHTSRILSVAFRPDGARLLTTSSDETVRQWDAATGKEVEAPYDRHTGEVTAAVYSPDGQWVASAGIDRTVRVWRATGRQDMAIRHGHTGAVVGLAFAPDGLRLASLSSETAFWGGDSAVRVWDVDHRATLPVLRGHTRAVYPVAFSPDGRWIASGSWDRTVRLWDAETGEPCATLPHPGIVRTLAYSPDSRWLVTSAEGEDRLRIWDAATARILKVLPAPGPSVRLLAVSADGARVAATHWDAQAKNQMGVYDIASGERLFSAAGGGLAYSPDGRWLAVLAEDEKTVLLLDARTHEIVARLPGHEKLVYSASFSPDSRRLASCSSDRTIRLWEIDAFNLNNGSSLPSGTLDSASVKSRPADGAFRCQVLRGHTDEVFTAAFHPDGTRLATGGRDRAIWLWDLARGEAVARLQGHTSFVWSLAFNRDGATLVSASGDSTVRLWDTAPLKTRYQARRQAAVLQPEGERLVERLWRQKNTPGEVVEALRADRALGEPLRQAALRAVLRKAMRQEAAQSNAHHPS